MISWRTEDSRVWLLVLCLQGRFIYHFTCWFWSSLHQFNSLNTGKSSVDWHGASWLIGTGCLLTVDRSRRFPCQFDVWTIKKNFSLFFNPSYEGAFWANLQQTDETWFFSNACRGSTPASLASIALAVYLAVEHYRSTGGVNEAFKSNKLLPTLAILALVVIPILFFAQGVYYWCVLVERRTESLY